ncbi:MAG: hypothetical protein QM723_35640 [Myxococcaceae bacterium]
MEELLKALEPYQRWDPQGWVAVYQRLPLPVAGGMIALGLLMLLFGSGRLFRVVAGPIGAIVGFIWAPILAQRFGFGAAQTQIRTVAAGMLFGLGILFPPAATFFAAGIPAGLIAGEVAGSNDWALGFVPAFIVVGALGVALHRYIGAIASSAVGSWLLVLGALGVMPGAGWVKQVAAQPWGLLVAAFLFTLAGSVYQLFVRLSPEERERIKAERATAKSKLKKQKDLEDRWANYSKNRGN